MQIRRKERFLGNPGSLPPILGKLGSLLFFVAMFTLAEPNQNGYAQFRKCHTNCVNGLLHAIGMPPAVAGVFLIIRSVSDCANFTRYLQGSVLTSLLVLYLRNEAHPYTPWLYYFVYMGLMDRLLYRSIYKSLQWTRLSFLWVGVVLIAANVGGLEVLGHGVFEHHHSYVLEFFNSVFHTPLYGINSVWTTFSPRSDHTCWV